MAYTATAATLGKGVTIGHCTTSGGTYVVFAEIIDTIDGPEKEAPSIKATNADSPAQEFIPGFIGSKEVEFSCNLTSADFIIADGLVAVVPMFFKITLPNKVSTIGNVISFGGYVVSVKPKVPIESKITHTIKIQPSGTVAIAAAS